jgi:hypothetical protein
MVKEPMKVTYICERCGAIFGVINLDDQELEQLGMDPLTVEMRQDIIKSTETGGLFVYSLCDDCVDTMSLHESDWLYMRPPELH